MKPNVLIIGSASPRMQTPLQEAFTLHDLSQADDKAAFLRDIGPSIDGIMTNGHGGVNAEIMGTLPNLKIISSYGVGYDTIDVDTAVKRDVIVTHTPNVLNDEVADTTVMLWLGVARRMVAADAYVRAGRWANEGPYPLTRSVQRRKVGIVGLGRIGMVIAERLAMFKAEISYYSRSQKDVEFQYFDNVTALASHCDVLICIVPGGAQTRHLINREVMDALGPEGILINVARGTVVDELAMVSALQDGRLGGAGLDVFEDEPNVPSALFDMDNVVLQPHVGSATVETRQMMGDLTVENLIEYFANGAPVTPVPECQGMV